MQSSATNRGGRLAPRFCWKKEAKRGFSPVRALLMWAQTAALWRVQQSKALAAAHPTPDLPTPPARSEGRPAGGKGVSHWKGVCRSRPDNLGGLVTVQQ